MVKLCLAFPPRPAPCRFTARRSPISPIFARPAPRQFCYNTHLVRVRTLKTTTFHDSERVTTHLSGCVVVSLFCQAPVVGVKVGGDAAAHPVFCLSSFFLPCHVYALLAHTQLAAHNALYAKNCKRGCICTLAWDSP